MSTEQQSLDPQLIEQTKQQIRGLVSEIARLAKSDASAEEFYEEFLPKVVSALAAIGGAVWTATDQGQLALAYQVNLHETKLQDKPEEQQQHGRLLQKVLTSGEGAIVQPHSGSGDDTEAANPTDFLLVLGPLKTDMEVIGVIEILQRPGAGPGTQRGYMRFLMQMCDLAADFLKTRKLKHFSDRQTLWTQLEEFARTIHMGLDPRETAFTIANEGRRLIECDRVSVAINKGRKCHIEAISGQDTLDKRSNVVRLLGKLSTAVVAGGEPIWYTGDTSDMAPQIEDAVQEYVDESHSKTVAILPLTRPHREADDEKEELEQREYPQLPVGALIVEQIEDARVPDSMRQRVDVVCEHSCTAMANSLEHNNLFLMPVWRALGNTAWVLRARTLPKTVAITAAILFVIGIFFFLPWGFKLKASGTLEPVLRRDVFAGIDGQIEEVLVGHGDPVEKNQVLARMRNTELDVQIESVFGELQAALEDQLSLEGQFFRAERLSTLEKDQLNGRLKQTDLRVKSLQSQLTLYESQREELQIKSPARGEVVTWDVRNRLIARPVQQGQSLMRVADPSGPWRLEILMGENRMGHIVRAQQAQREKIEKKIKDKQPNISEPDLDRLLAARSPEDLKEVHDLLGEEVDARLTVEFILATDPDRTFSGKVFEVAESAEVRGDEGNTVLIRVAIDKDELIAELQDKAADQLKIGSVDGTTKELRPGAGVTAKIDCGTRPIGYVLFHDAIAFFRSRIWFTMF